MTGPLAIVPPRVAFLDPRTGDISRQWYLLILAIVNRLGGDGLNLDDLSIGSIVGDPSPGLDDILRRLDVALGSLPASAHTEAAPFNVNLAPTVIADYRHDDVSPVTWVGTLGQQNADRVSITGGSADGVAIGAAAASTGKFTTLTSSGGASFLSTSAALTNGAAAAAGTLANAPIAGNPTKWVGINDNGTIRYIPAW